MNLSAGDYVEMLALYLGDGYIVQAGRTFRLRIYLDRKHTGIADSCEALLTRCFPDNTVNRMLSKQAQMVVMSVYSCHLPCLFPQHGPGPKKTRSMGLEAWQQDLVDEHPWRLLKGLIHTDGCSFINRTGRYEYLSFHFVNTAEGIADQFGRACRNVGVEYRCNFNNHRQIWEFRINRRASVALLEEHVGVKR